MISFSKSIFPYSILVTFPANFLSKQLQNSAKVIEQSLTKIIVSFTSFHKFLNQDFNELLINLSSFNKTNIYKLDKLPFKQN